MPSERRFWNTRFASLRYAIVWSGYGLMRLLILLPFEWQLWLGRRAGSALGALARSRRRIVSRNLEMCFPELTPSERSSLMDEHFKALGASLPEMAMGWFGPEETVRRLVDVQGEEHLRAALEKGKGVILFSAHFTCLEFCFPALKPLCPRLTGMYKEQRNPVMNKLMNRGRGRNVDEMFAKDNVRGMLKNLARNAVVWYASDQSYGRKGSMLVPFFGEPAMTNTAICRIAKSSGAVVLPYFYRRLPDHSYAVNIYPPLDGFPSDDPVHDIERFNRLLEDYIRTCPEQYWWIHQRFKGRPSPYPNVYVSSDAR